ncbi:MAG TPA: FAD-dependent monooxygenase [Candidatus Polarisedimenticolaceae bacterium]
MSWFKSPCEVLVAGAGPVGQFCALELARRGISVRVLEEQWRTTSRSYALGLHPRTLELLDAHGLAEPLIAQGHRMGSVVLRDAKGEKGRLDFAHVGGKFPFLLVLPQFALEAALEQALEKRGVKVEWNHRLDSVRPEGTKVVAVVHKLGKETMGYAAATTEWVVEKEFEVEPSFIVGADGHRSKVRRATGIGYPEVGPSQLFAVFEFQAEGSPLSEVHIVLEEGRSNVLWSMREGRFRWGFEITDPAAAEDERKKSRLLVGFDDRSYPAIEPEKLGAFIAERAPWFLPRVTEVFWSAAIRFERRLVDRFGEGHVWLVGDAAHLASPIGMNSMNVGLREGRDLAWSIARRLREPAAGDALATYDAQRTREWKRLLGLEGAPAVATGADPWVRANAARIVDCAPSSGTALRSVLAPLGIQPAVEEEWAVPV